MKTELLKSILGEEQARGKTIILSTHNMAQVEEMCDRILLINHGKAVLYGRLDEIKAQYAEHAVILECEGSPPALSGVQRVEQHNHTYELVLDQDTSPQAILQQLVAANVAVQRFEVATPPLDEIFISVVEEIR